MNLYFYAYRIPDEDGTVGLNFIIAPDADTAVSLLPADIPALTQIGGITCDGPARVIAGIGAGLFPPST
jgi:hypothetical protein